MSDLIQSQTGIIIVMIYCGMLAALIYDVFTLFIRRFIKRVKIIRIIVRLLGYAVIGFAVADFCMYCQNGKITLTGFGCFACGVWLWRKFLYDIIDEGEKHEQKGEKTQRI